MAILRRALLILAAYLAASLAAGAVLMIVLLRPGLDDFLGTNPNSGAIWGPIVIATISIAILALLPSFLGIVIAEVLRLRSIAFYAVAGFGSAVFCYVGLGFFKHAGDLANEVLGFVLAGVTAGVVYWAIAGRKPTSKKPA